MARLIGQKLTKLHGGYFFRLGFQVRLGFRFQLQQKLQTFGMEIDEKCLMVAERDIFRGPLDLGGNLQLGQ